MTLTERAAYIKGLAEGLGVDESSKEGKLIRALIDLSAEMAEVIAEQAEDIEMLNDYIEEIDDDLADVEDYLEGEDDEDDDEDEDEDEFDDEDEEFFCDGECEGCSGCDDEEFYEIVCPSCGETVCFDQELDPESLTCPACGEKFGCIVDEEDFEQLTEEKDED